MQKLLEITIILYSESEVLKVNFMNWLVITHFQLNEKQTT